MMEPISPLCLFACKHNPRHISDELTEGRKNYYGEQNPIGPFIPESPEEYYQGKSAYACDAFPDGIPFDIVRDIRKHYKNVKGDNGIKFEPREGIDPKDLPR